MARFKFHNDQVIAGLDIRSSSICCSVALKKTQGELQFLSFNEKPSKGLEGSRIVDFNSLIPVIGELLEEAEDVSKSSFSEVWVGLNSPFQSFTSQGMVVLPTREVIKKDIELALETACAVPLSPRHQMIHKLPQGFNIDGKGEVVNPIGLSGLRLETTVRIVTVPEFYCQDLVKVLKVLGCAPKGFVYSLIAYGENLVEDQRKKEGCCFCDIGQKSSRFIIYHKGKIKKLFSLPIGGECLTLALAHQFKVSYNEAEYLKIQKGRLQAHSILEEEVIQGEREDFFLSKKSFSQTLEKSLSSFFQSIKNYISSNELEEYLSSGFVFSGSTSLLPGFLEMAQLELGASVSYPLNIISETKNSKQDKIFSLIKQAYAMEEFPIQNSPHTSRWLKLKELF